MARKSRTGLILLGAAGIGAVFFWKDIQNALASAGHSVSHAGPCDTSFKAGVQYVAKGADGMFHVVVNGRDIYQSADQGTAERYYNQAVCS